MWNGLELPIGIDGHADWHTPPLLTSSTLLHNTLLLLIFPVQHTWDCVRKSKLNSYEFNNCITNFSVSVSITVQIHTPPTHPRCLPSYHYAHTLLPLPQLHSARTPRHSPAADGPWALQTFSLLPLRWPGPGGHHVSMAANASACLDHLQHYSCYHRLRWMHCIIYLFVSSTHCMCACKWSPNNLTPAVSMLGFLGAPIAISNMDPLGLNIFGIRKPLLKLLGR